MDKDEMKMIEDIMTIIVRHRSGLGCDVLCDGDQCKNCYLTAKDLYYAKYRKVGEDEIVVKKRQYEQLKKYNRDRKRLRLKWQQAKQETREILQVLKDNIVNRIGSKYAVIDLTDIAQRANKLGIELED